MCITEYSSNDELRHSAVSRNSFSDHVRELP